MGWLGSIKDLALTHLGLHQVLRVASPSSPSDHISPDLPSNYDMASSMARLPDEILAYILSHGAVSDMVVSLYLCGDRSLNARLCRGGCTSFVATIDELLQWPQMLSQLKSLREVSLSAREIHQYVHLLRKELLKLPSELEILHLDFPEATETLFATLPSSSSNPQEPSLRAMDLVSNRFTQLKSLTLGPRRRLEDTTQMVPQMLASLPRSLLSLGLGDTLPHPFNLDMLPPNLTQLHFPSSDHAPVATSLPRTLTECSSTFSHTDLTHLSSLATLSYLDGTSFSETAAVALPRGLTRLSLQSLQHFDSNLWPSTLTSMRVGRVDTAILQQLPQSLVSLTIGSLVDYNQQIKALTVEAAIALWPKRLMSLIFENTLSLPFDKIATLPPSLTTIKKVLIGFKRTLKTPITFSPLLKHLEFSCDSTTTHKVFVQLPQLETLAVSWKDYAAMISEHPESLRSLHLDSTVRYGYLTSLPRNLTSLYLLRLECKHGDAFQHLPPTLKILKVRYLPSIAPKDLAMLPHTLEALFFPTYSADLYSFLYLSTNITSLEFKSIHPWLSPELAAQLPLRWLRFLLTTHLIRSNNELLLRHWPASKPIPIRSILSQVQLGSRFYP